MFRNFLKKHKSAIVFIGDVGIFAISLILMIFIRYESYQFNENLRLHTKPFEALLLLWVFVFYAMDLYSYTSWRTTHPNIRKFIIAFLLNFVLSICIFYIFGEFFKVTPKINLVVFASFFFLLDSAWRLLVTKILSSRNNNKTIAIISSSPLAEEIVNHCAQHPQLGYSTEIYSDLESAKSAIQKNKDKIIVLIDSSFTKDINTSKSLHELLMQHTEISTLTDFYENLVGSIPLSEIKEEWLIQEIKSDRNLYEAVKRFIDVIFSITGIIIFSPFFIIFFILIPLTSKGAAIYKQKRVGKDGKIFTLFKFRSMYQNAEKDGAVWAQKNDLRTTKIGNFLRRTHFDELPQLFNILIGEMSVVGPRPERPEFTEGLKNEIPYYFMRQTVKTGLTGWAQIMFRYANTVNEQKEKFKYDLYYIKNRNTLLDIGIIIRTIKLFFSK